MMERSWIAGRTADIVKNLRANGFGADDAVNRNVLKLFEEAGEVAGAFLEWTGQSRRSATEEAFQAEVADVVITAYVLAEEAGFDLDAAVEQKLGVIFSRGWRESPEVA